MALQVDRGLERACQLLGWWDEVEAVTFLGDDELKTPELDVGG
jgi:hypothetical protein